MKRFFSWSHFSCVLLAFLPACGGDDGGGAPNSAQIAETCNKTCNKEKECLGAAASGLDCDQICSPSNLQKSTTSGSKVDCDYAKLNDKFEACLSVECKDLESCMEEASNTCSQTSTTSPGGTTSPDQKPSPGGGGDTPPGSGEGDAGTGSSATPPPGNGSGTSSDCSVCAHAQSCCIALLGSAGGADPGACDAFSEAQCKATPAAQQSTFIQLCSQTLEGGAASGVGACKQGS